MSRENLFAIGAVLLMFSCSVWLADYIDGWAIIGNLLYISASVALHFSVIRKQPSGRFSLPLAWALCLIPSLIISQSVVDSGFLSNDFAFIIFAFVFIVPSFLLSLLLSIFAAGRTRIPNEQEE